MFTSEFILSMKRKALRRGLWYHTLDHDERSILSLTARVVERVESALLGAILVKILKKLRDVLNNQLVNRLEYGIKRAWEIAAQAVAWGYNDAESWATDNDFINYLTLLDVNTTS